MKYIIIFSFVFCSWASWAQDSLSEWSIAPALSVNPASATLGVGNIGLGLLSSYQPHKRWVLSNYTQFQNVWFHNKAMFNANLKTHYNLQVNHLYGGGLAIYSKKSVNYVQLLGGLNYHQFKESIQNTQRNIDYQYRSDAYWSFNYGLMWNSRKRLGENIQFSMRYFFPLKNGRHLVDNLNNSALDVGILFDL